MNKYSYLNLNQKMIKIRKKIPSLIRKRYSEDVDYDFVKLDDINQFLTPALNKYGVDFDILREIPTQTDPSGNPAFLISDGNLWRYEADLEICWTNADHPEEKILSTVHLVGTNDVADKAKGTALTYGLKYYLLNKFNIPQNGEEDPDMNGKKPAKEPQKEKTVSRKTEHAPKRNEGKGMEGQETAYVPKEELIDGPEEMKSPTGAKHPEEKQVRNGNACTSDKPEESTETTGQFSLFDAVKEAGKAGEDKKTVPEKRDEAAADMLENPEDDEDDVTFSVDMEEEEGFDNSYEEPGDGFMAVAEEDEVPFSEQEDEGDEEKHYPEAEDNQIKKAKAVICNFGLFKGKPLGELLETQRGWEQLQWIARRYTGLNTEMKEAASLLVEADAYVQKAA